MQIISAAIFVTLIVIATPAAIEHGEHKVAERSVLDLALMPESDEVYVIYAVHHT